MFCSYRYIGYNNKTKQYEDELIDSYFTVLIKSTVATPFHTVIAQEYVNRNVSVAKNIALLCLYMETQGNSMEEIVYWQDRHCSKVINNWGQIASERNRYLDKLSAMK